MMCTEFNNCIWGSLYFTKIKTSRKKTKRKIILALEHKISGESKVMSSFIRDNGGKRSGLDRRQFSYDKHIPERRSDKDRRSGLDRRLKPRNGKSFTGSSVTM